MNNNVEIEYSLDSGLACRIFLRTWPKIKVFAKVELWILYILSMADVTTDFITVIAFVNS
jgi:hypothetical protein